MAETVNFRLFHNQSRETAEKTLRVAEAARMAASKKWFGEPAPTWSPRCDIYLHATANDYSMATHQPPQLAGHSSIGHGPDRVVSRRIDIHFDDPNMLIGVLPHETTHVVLADGYNRPLPHWADEGMAVLSEPRERVERHLHNLPQHRSNGETFAVAELIPMDQYPSDSHRIGAFYAESVSLVEFLSKEKGEPVFVQFMRDGMQSGYEPALQKYYGIHGYDDLQQRWQRYAFSGLAQARANRRIASDQPCSTSFSLCYSSLRLRKHGNIPTAMPSVFPLHGSLALGLQKTSRPADEFTKPDIGFFRAGAMFRAIATSIIHALAHQETPPCLTASLRDWLPFRVAARLTPAFLLCLTASFAAAEPFSILETPPTKPTTAPVAAPPSVQVMDLATCIHTAT